MRKWGNRNNQKLKAVLITNTSIRLTQQTPVKISYFFTFHKMETAGCSRGAPVSASKTVRAKRIEGAGHIDASLSLCAKFQHQSVVRIVASRSAELDGARADVSVLDGPLISH